MNHCEEDDDSDLDTDEIKGQLRNMQAALQRHFGHHKDLARLKSDDLHGEKKEFVVVTPDLVRSSPSETLLAMRKEMEIERKRRIEAMMDEEDDEESKFAAEAKRDVNEELLKLFAFHDSKYQTESEKVRKKVEDAKDIMHEELLRRYAQKMVDIEVEQERKRKLSELDKLVKGEAENQLELAQTSENLIKVQNDLKNAFKIATKSKERKESITQKISEDRKEIFLQDMRRQSAISRVKQMSSKEQQQRIAEFDEHMRTMMSADTRKLLVNVQEQLLGLFSKLKRDKEVQKVIEVDKTKLNKARMQEELVRTASRKLADREASAERARRIKEQNIERNERQETIDMLLDVQKQLLDACGHLQSEDLKYNAKLVQFLKTRQNLLSDIRSQTGIDAKRQSKSLEQGRRLSLLGDWTELQRNEKKLSIIGEQFDYKMSSQI
ncbi:trichohyalin-like [Xenia sp. Carnegie-2017]|uniref:trichohyalin-like n=1 Tax=Xenia sp. Carnegie-2017 TaxID=2897299 RepID=UPI001F035F24|nr:trichohyalin-like [Xenia sp. Carnegie-2017]